MRPLCVNPVSTSERVGFTEVTEMRVPQSSKFEGQTLVPLAVVTRERAVSRLT